MMGLVKNLHGYVEVTTRQHTVSTMTLVAGKNPVANQNVNEEFKQSAIVIITTS